MITRRTTGLGIFAVLAVTGVVFLSGNSRAAELAASAASQTYVPYPGTLPGIPNPSQPSTLSLGSSPHTEPVGKMPAKPHPNSHSKPRRLTQPATAKPE